jgi:EAL domain-containing protein (putative c-di-GMP-specific phosphodiesterase class I)
MEGERMTAYEKLLRERIEMRHDDLFRINQNFFRALSTSGMAIAQLEQLCVELACQMFAFSSKRAAHLPILAAFRDRADCEEAERAVLLRIREGCAE